MKLPLSPLALLTPLLVFGPALTCVIPRVMAPLFIACTILAIVADYASRREWRSFDRTLTALFGGILLFGAASYGWSISPEGTVKKFGQLAIIFGPLVGALPMIAAMNTADLRRMGMRLGLGLVLGLAVYISEMHTGFALWALTHGADSTAVVDNKQNKAVVLLAIWFYLSAAFVWPEKKTVLRLAYVALGILVFYATFSSRSASAQLVVAGAPILAGILYFLPTRFSLRLTLASCALLAIAMPFIAMGVNDHTAWRTNAELNDSVKSRIEIWNQAASRTFEKPVFGWGLNSSPELPNREDESYLTGHTISHLHPHNALLQIWFEMGAIGIAALCALFFVFSKRIQNMGHSTAQKFAVFMWVTTFLYTLSIWGIWQSWFTASLCFAGLMTAAGVRYIKQATTLSS